MHHPATQLHRPATQLHRPTSQLHHPATQLHHPTSQLHRPATQLHPSTTQLHRPTSQLHRPASVASLKCCNKFSCGVDILSAPDGRDAHPTRGELMHYFSLATPLHHNAQCPMPHAPCPIPYPSSNNSDNAVSQSNTQLKHSGLSPLINPRLKSLQS
jgi:hypothetical protein